MAYTPPAQPWANDSAGGTPITAAELNRMEANALAAAATFGPTSTGGNDTTLVTSHLAALGSAGGGRWDLQGQTFIVRSAVTIPPNVHLENGVFNFDTDLGSGVVAVTLNNGGDSVASPSLTRMKITAPSVTMAYGTVGNAMDGVKTCSSAVLTECTVTSFRANLLIFSNHERIVGGKYSSGYYNIYYTSGASTHGDQVFLDVDMTGSRFASIGVASDNMIDSAMFVAGHVGFGPYGIYKETGTSTQAFIHDTKMFGTSFEAIGNGAILDDSTNKAAISSLAKSLIDGPGFSWDATRKITARNKDYAVNVGDVTGTRVIAAVYGFTAGDVGIYRIGSGAAVAALDSGLADPWRPGGPAAWYDEPFIGANGATWPSGWSGYGTFDQQSGAGRAIAEAGGYGAYGNFKSAPANAEALVRWRWTNGGSDVLTDLTLRDTAGGTYYGIRVSPVDIVLRKSVAGVGSTAIGSAAGSYVVGNWYWTRLRVKGTDLRAKVWADGEPEPAAWSVAGTDSTITAAGSVGLTGEGSQTGGQPISVLYDRLQVFEL